MNKYQTKKRKKKKKKKKKLFATPSLNRKRYFDWSVSTSAFQTCVFADGTAKSVIVEIELQNCDKPQFITLANVLYEALIESIYKTEKL